ncbi:MAG: ATP-grasp domain-containing protein, partial [Candidatus Dormibacteraeota bacterium]|nr:ATP-grasp domain-containing protein [Candidatus Dormibacteraeota bacterium]
PCRQVTGVDWLTPEPLGSCGNAWGDGRLVPHLEEVNRCVRALGADLASNNYRGLYGVDFVLAEDGPLVIEVNPRMVASIPVATELEVEAGRAPLVLLHLLELLGAELSELDGDQGDGVLGEASQVIVHRLEGDTDMRPRGGIYLASAGAVTYIRPGATLEDLTGADEVLLLARRTGEPVSDRKEFARIYARTSTGENTPGIRDLVHSLRAGTVPEK